MNIEERRKYDREWKRQYKLKNPNQVKEKRRERYYREKQNPEWLKKHRAYMSAYQKKWEKDNPRTAYKREYMKKWYRKHAKEIYTKRREKPYEKISSALRTRLKNYMKFEYNSPQTYKIVGMTPKELKIYLEAKFQPGMTWKNYGEWHLDHIFPLSKAKNILKAFHYTNLQPLWAKENMRKHAKVL